MGTKVVTERGIIGEFMTVYNGDPALKMLAKLVWSNLSTDQEIETYKWLGQSPAMREFGAGRQAKGLNDFEYVIKNILYEATLKIPTADIRRDKFGQIMARVRDMSSKAAAHPWSLIASLIYNGATQLCYDGQNFFDTGHTEGESGVQSNSLSIDISALPTAAHGSVTDPSDEEMALCIFKAISQIMSFRDDRGDPMNEFAREFTITVPPSLGQAAHQAITAKQLTQGKGNPLVDSGFQIEVATTPRLAPATSPWTDEFAVFETSGEMKPFILQEEDPLAIDVLGAGTDHEFKEKEWLVGVDATRGAGYGLWQKACKVRMT